MYPVIPMELMQNAVQSMVYFVTIVGAVLRARCCAAAAENEYLETSQRDRSIRTSAACHFPFAITLLNNHHSTEKSTDAGLEPPSRFP